MFFYESMFIFYFLLDCQKAPPYQQLAVKSWSVWLNYQMSQFDYQDNHLS